ncbi:MAG TPA: hypothetical protein VII38_17650 [Polyangia bacterium]
MQVARTPAFDEESARFALRFCCEDCGHFDAASERCRHGWPTDEHRQDRYADRWKSERPLSVVTFCKEFELC